MGTCERANEYSGFKSFGIFIDYVSALHYGVSVRTGFFFVVRELRAITESAFKKIFQLKKCWERCMASRGDYFEGDSA
jgi:hypothetical protein